MSKNPDTSQVLFKREYERELETWLHRRFGYLCMIFVALGFLQLVVSIFEMFGDNLGGAILTALRSGGLLCIVAYYFLQREQYETRDAVLRGLARMILALGGLSLAGWLVTDWMELTTVSSVLLAIFFLHFISCLFLPWTPGESLRPILPLLGIWIVLKLLFSDSDPTAIGLMIIISPAILLPGLLICGWRLRSHSKQFRSTMLGKHFKTLRQEFTKARGIHESMFPDEYDDGYVRLQYKYIPMRELGGDFLHVHIGAEGLVHLTLLDVTGHGLPATLSVNRLFGELERIRAELPRAKPAEVIRLLNRYINLTMTRHNIYATAIVLQLDPYSGEISWASAGHPPAFLRGVNGTVKSLPATGVVLGALPDEEFEIDEKTMELSPGDMILAYTDGAFEVRDRMGQQLGLDGLRDLLHKQPQPGNWPQFICSSVEKYKAGRTEDDVLVAALTYISQRLQTKSAPAPEIEIAANINPAPSASKLTSPDV